MELNLKYHRGSAGGALRQPALMVAAAYDLYLPLCATPRLAIQGTTESRGFDSESYTVLIEIIRVRYR
jgi:hypothetical protein